MTREELNPPARRRRLGAFAMAGSALIGSAGLLVSATIPASAQAAATGKPLKVYANDQIRHVMVIDLENESESTLFQGSSAPSYLTNTLEPMGTLIQNYYAVGHVSNDNYASQVSGQAPNLVNSSDCITSTQPAGSFDDLTPGTLDSNQTAYPGQVDGQGCVFPASVQTIGGQLSSVGKTWRSYAEDMGNDVTRDGGQVDALGGTDCAHPAQVSGMASDPTNSAEGPNATGSQHVSSISDQYANRHNPFIYFHSVIDNVGACDSQVVPLGTVTLGTGGSANSFSGHLVQDLASPSKTPAFSFITPNLCNDGHDSTCAGTNAAGTTAGGLTGINDWLSTWMPLILDSPAYQSGKMLVVITTDEAALGDSSAGGGETPGPNSGNPGYSPLLNEPIAAFGGLTYYQLLGVRGITPGVEPAAGTLPGGGKVGALVLNPKWVAPGVVDTTGSYNHYSALRTFEDLLGITTGGADGQGHLGFASTASDFGNDVFLTTPLGG